MIFDQILNGAKGLKAAAEGAAKLAEAAKQASVGADQLSSGLRQSGDGMKKLEAGITPLTAGANELENGLIRLGTIAELFNKTMVDWTNRRTSGGDKLSDADKQLEVIQNGLLTTMGQVRTNVQQMKNSLQAVNDSAAQLQKVRDAAAPIQDKLDTLAQNMDEGRASLNELGQQFADLSKDERFKRAVQRLEAAEGARAEAEQALTALNQSIESLSASMQQATSQLSGNAAAMLQTLDKLSSDMESFRTSAKNASDWLDQQKSLVDSVSDRISDVAAGVMKLQDGSGKLVNGMLQLYGGVEALRVGNTKLEEGANSLRDGLKQISSGQAELANKLTDAAAIAAKDDQSEKRQQIIQNPVEMEETNLHPVPSNGVGFAPYFIALSLWVGSLVLFFVIDITQVRAHPRGPLSYLTNKYLALCSVSVCQALLSVFILHAGLGIPTVEAPMAMYAYAILIGLVFTAILFMMISILGSDVGRFAAVLILMLQLTSSSGSYPVELEPGLFRFIQPYLPMTYAVEGLRHLISTGGAQEIIRTALVLSGFGLCSLLLLYVVKRHKVMDEIQHTAA
ncbi:YhgE/Pip family protein [Paenibacillus solisilvae]|uniref:YhgE/Pip family protein n=1 Tax=Paenibacillus solisilvae TaxID=2486751 RepID=A0ABW0VS04_9BACL